MPETKSFFQRIVRFTTVAAYVVAAAWFLWVCSQFYLPGKGFTYLIMFGDQDSANFLPELKALNHYEIPNSPGYDAAHYAQIAMHPNLGDAELSEAVDSLPYRARRILFCWSAYVLGFGNPAWALQIYAVQNIVCWVLLALLLLRWFPPTGWGNFVRWAGVLFSFGLCFSVRASLVDGPSLLLIAIGVALAEAGRPWWSAAALGISGLGKETNILAGAALAEPAALTHHGDAGAGRAVRVTRILGRLALVVLPLAAWLLALKLWVGEAMNPGYRNFALPFSGYLEKWAEVLADLRAPDTAHTGRGSALVAIVLTTQFLFFALRPRWNDLWWRVGASYSVLMMFLGDAVWEGYPGAASRVLLPMALAFNILVPRGARWLPVLLLGNLTFLLSPDALQPPPGEAYHVTGARALRLTETGHTLEIAFDDNWYGPERTRFESWRWTRGSASFAVRNPQPFGVLADITFELRVQSDRNVIVRVEGRELWRGAMQEGAVQEVTLRDIMLRAGETTFTWETDAPATRPPNDDPREVAFNVRDLTIRLKARSEPR